MWRHAIGWQLSMGTRPSSSPRLRPGQASALKRWAAALRSGEASELVVVPVGYGKTVIGVGSFDVAANLAGADMCLYLTPTDVLRQQVYDGVERALGMLGSTRPVRKILADNGARGRIAASQANFVVATYQQVVANPGIYQSLARERRLHVVCDEAHHLGESGRWAEAVGSLAARSTLLLSATPVRLDRDALAGARYVDDGDRHLVIDPLVVVSMRQAWDERRILKYLQMQMKDYAVRLRDTNGEIREFTASDMADLPDFDQRCVRRELRWLDDYVEPLVREFAETLLNKMRSAPGQHQGLVFAATTEHANHLAQVFDQWEGQLRCVVVHSGEIADGENARRMQAFHRGDVDVLIQVKKASEGFDAPRVSVLLKLDAVHSREPVIQQLGRGLRYNHALPDRENVLHVFIGRDPRLGPIIDGLRRESLPAIERRDVAERPVEEEAAVREQDEDADGLEMEAPEIVDVVEAGDAYLDHTGQLVEGQQLNLFGEAVAPVRPAVPQTTPGVTVVDLDRELREAIEYCRAWTNRAAKARAKLRGPGENHFAALNLAYGQATGKRGQLRTAAEYRAKGDWMKRRYAELL